MISLWCVVRIHWPLIAGLPLPEVSDGGERRRRAAEMSIGLSCRILMGSLSIDGNSGIRIHA